MASSAQIKPVNGLNNNKFTDSMPQLFRKVSQLSENLNPIREEQSFGLDDEEDYFR